jgi:hypothetical protein
VSQNPGPGFTFHVVAVLWKIGLTLLIKAFLKHKRHKGFPMCEVYHWWPFKITRLDLDFSAFIHCVRLKARVEILLVTLETELTHYPLRVQLGFCVNQFWELQLELYISEARYSPYFHAFNSLTISGLSLWHDTDSTQDVVDYGAPCTE